MSSFTPAGTSTAKRNMEQLAGDLHMQHQQRRGIQYARKEHIAVGDKQSAKNEARARALRMFAGMPTKRPRILSMPGLNWAFERSLRTGYPKAQLVCIESDEAVYRAAIEKMPGLRSGRGVRWIESRDFETCSFQTDEVARFSRCEFHDMAHLDDEPFHGAWLDFNGQLTPNRMAAIAALWERISHVLVVTLLDARSTLDYDAEIGALPDSQITDVHRYVNGRSRMIQFGLGRRSTLAAYQFTIAQEQERNAYWKSDNSPKMLGGAPFFDGNR